MSKDIYLPDTHDSIPTVIKVNGLCYEYVETISRTEHKEDTCWDEVQKEYDNCEDCCFPNVKYIKCGSSSSACSGSHELCSDCDCGDPIQDTYQITISGMPSICTAQAFNGTWTVSWQQDCTWWYDIDAWRRITLSISGGWFVAWRVSSGASGDFSALGGSNCQPESASWSPNNCFEPFGCSGLCSSYYTNATCVVNV